MKKITILYFICILLFPVIFFSGCSLNYTDNDTNDGEIVEKVSFVIDEELLLRTEYISHYGLNVTKMLLTYELNSELNNLLTYYNQEILRLTNEAKTSNPDIVDNYEEITNGVDILTQPSWQDNTFVCEIKFRNTLAYNIFYNSELSFSQTDKVDKALYSKYYYNGSLEPCLNYGLYSYVKPQMLSLFKSTTTNDIVLSFSKTTSGRRYHSNAKTVNLGNNGYIHTWTANENSQDLSLTFYLKIAKRSLWFVFAILISLTLAIILIIILIIVSVIKKHNNKSLIYRIIKTNKKLNN